MSSYDPRNAKEAWDVMAKTTKVGQEALKESVRVGSSVAVSGAKAVGRFGLGLLQVLGGLAESPLKK